jgi:hypothetical protein
VILMRRHCYFVAVVAILGMSFGLAAQDTVHSDQREAGTDEAIVVELRDVPRRVALDRLLPSDVRVQWSDDALANEVVSGNFRGTQANILRHVLARLNFIVAYDDSQTRITRIVVLGRGLGPSPPEFINSAPGLQQADALRQAAAVEEKQKRILLSQRDSATMPNVHGRQQIVPEYKTGSAPAQFPVPGANDKADAIPLPTPGNTGAQPLPFPSPDRGGGNAPSVAAPAWQRNN